MKRVRIKSSHGVLLPGGLPNSPRRAAWRSRQQTLTFLATALVLYGIMCTIKTLLRDADVIPVAKDVRPDHRPPPPPPPFVYETTLGSLTVATGTDCPEYGVYASTRHAPTTGGRFDLPLQRPAARCRKVTVPEVEATIDEMRALVQDPDLFRLFENCFPNTLDTSIAWTGVSSDSAAAAAAAAAAHADGDGDGDDHHHHHHHHPPAGEELAFITTGDIHAMWLRDSANQLQSYVGLLQPSAAVGVAASSSSSPAPSSQQLASLFRGAINLQARYLLASPYCNAFQPPAEANLPPGNDGNPHDIVFPAYDRSVVFECKYELDSLAAFLQLSWDYFSRTQDTRFFVDASRGGGGGGGHGRKQGVRARRHGWKHAVETILDMAEQMRQPTYRRDGMVPDSPYRFERFAAAATETLSNRGNGSPVRDGTGLVRSAFRPSDDATTFQFLVPANMMLAHYLERCAAIMAAVERELGKEVAAARAQAAMAKAETGKQEVLRGGGGGGGGGDEEDEEWAEDDDDDDDDGETVTERMRRMASEIKKGIEKHGKVKHPEFGDMYAYEVDGYHSAHLMDDANLPSLLSSPLTGYVKRTDSIYRATRRFALSTANPYYDHGVVLNATGGPHIGPGMAWPMSLIVGIMTSDDDDEIEHMLFQLVSSTDGLGLMHESVNVHNAHMWTRSWFSWANGLFGQMMLDLRARKPHLLRISFQNREIPSAAK